MTGLMLAVSALPRGKTRIVAASVLALTLAVSSWAWLSRYQKEAWRDLGAHLPTNVQPGDVVLLCESALYLSGQNYSAGTTGRGHALSLTPYRARTP